MTRFVGNRSACPAQETIVFGEGAVGDGHTAAVIYSSSGAATRAIVREGAARHGRVVIIQDGASSQPTTAIAGERAVCYIESSSAIDSAASIACAIGRKRGVCYG